MSNLADLIEAYINRLLDASPNATLVLQRKELAERFQCVPSQINYVLSTRFTTERGYLIESRRGGGGFLRIKRLDLDREKVAKVLTALQKLNKGISRCEALDFVTNLAESKLITRRESNLMRAVLSQDPFQHEHACTKVLISMLEVILEEI
ncbi:MAG: CtsR family transcriptional regulator [Firmicutes bacterium]|nr:CtsR family transcriptional regulator [Bacillota bacterium]